VNLKRNIAKVKAHGSQAPNAPIIHFESINDMKIIQKMINKNNLSGKFESTINELIYNYTPKKSEAIKQHKAALDCNMNISTLVDMDHDLKNKDSRIKKGSPDRIPRIHTTKPSCTLRTYIYVENNKFDLDTFKESMRCISELAEISDREFIALKNIASEKTWERFRKAKGKFVSVVEKKFAKGGIPAPLNDHSLVETIMEKIYGYEMVDLNKLTDEQKKQRLIIEKKIEIFFSKQSQRVFNLLAPIFSDY
jgi:hypothetical protein